VISLKGVEISRYELPQGFELAIQTSKAPAQIEGTPTKEPAFGIAAVWVAPEHCDKARASGYTVVDAISVLGTHLSEVIRGHAHELFSRQDAKKLLDRVAEENPKVVEDLVPKLLPLALVQKVLQNLLRERVSIRDSGSILEALGEAANVTKNSILLTEYVRQSIRRMVVKPYLNPKGDLPAYFFEHALEHSVEASVEHSENMSHLNLSPQKIHEILERIQKTIGTPETAVVALTSSGARFFLRQIAENAVGNFVVLSHSEVPAGIRVMSLGRFSKRTSEIHNMKIKSYYSASVEAAMVQARQELGSDAMLLNSKRAAPEARHLGEYEVVFASPSGEPVAAAPHRNPVTGSRTKSRTSGARWSAWRHFPASEHAVGHQLRLASGDG
jgi:Flagellar biosynthesis pathway, component FlhA